MNSMMIGFVIISLWIMAILCAYSAFRSTTKRDAIIWAVISAFAAFSFMGIWPIIFWIGLVMLISIRWKKLT